MGNRLFAKKPVSLLVNEMDGAHRLRRVLGPFQLTNLGVGAIIGAGIFVVTGLAAKDKAGAAIMLSFVIAGSACLLPSAHVLVTLGKLAPFDYLAPRWFWYILRLRHAA